MNGQDEVELKLQASPQAIAKLLADPLFTDAAPVTRDQLSTYFDTDDRRLLKAGLSLRIRRTGDRLVQTVKAESHGTASLFARAEWERDVASDQPELTDIAAVLTHALDRADGQAPAAIFAIRVDRTKVVRGDGADRIELVADLGDITAGDHHAPISEIELELIDGDRGALFALARSLAARAPLRLGVRSKSERGYALLDGTDKPSAKAEPIALSRDIDTATLFGIIAGSCLRQFRLNEDRVIATGAPEAVHQARVGLRRLRSALSIFRDMLAGPELDRFRSELRDLARSLGAVRDVDVMIARIGDEALLPVLKAARASRLAAALVALDKRKVRALMLDLVEWIAIGPWRDDDRVADIRSRPALDYAPATLDRLRRKIKRRGHSLAKLSEGDRHKVRIAGKTLRYAAEFLSGLYPGKKAGRRREAFLTAIEDLQTALGHLNDLASGRALLRELGVPHPKIALSADKKGDTARLIADAEDAFERLVDTRRFWRED